MDIIQIHIEGDFRVLVDNTGTYIAHIKLKGADTIRIGQAGTPAGALREALGMRA